MLEEQYALLRFAFEKSRDPIWAMAGRPERMRLLRSACLTAADAAIRSEVEQLDDEVWARVLDTLEAEIAILVQGLVAD
jgi:hypothetical protein